MKLLITKKGVVDCTSDPRTHPIQSIQEGIANIIKIFENEVSVLDYADFYLDKNSKLIEFQGDKLETRDKNICLKLLQYFMKNPNQLSNKDMAIIYIHVDCWKFFNDGGNCSDYIEIFKDKIEVSCQDDYDEEMRIEFHNNIEELLGNECAIINCSSEENLISLHINVTEKCSAGCKTCYINKGLQRDLEKEDWDKIPIAEQYALGGGEPSEYQYITELVDYLKGERKGYLAITTNGQKLINFNTFPDKIAVSIDGLNQEEHGKTHNTDLILAETNAEIYKNKGIELCINHILHKDNIDQAKIFAEHWSSKGYDINFILFKGKDKLKPTYEQLNKFGRFFGQHQEKYKEKISSNITIDSCLSGLLNIVGVMIYGKPQNCLQGCFSKYYRFGSITPCSHSNMPYPRCNVIEDYMVYLFKKLRPMLFIYEKDGKSGAHEWAFRAGYQGKIRHKIDNPMRKDVIYILTEEESVAIKENHYQTHFKDKMPFWLCFNEPINKRKP